ncbi:MAG TPA: hypothetical protein DHU96_26900 [Actinobacteria bacterium]|nr:hypothetical protein [Actinomycetota bacterium]
MDGRFLKHDFQFGWVHEHVLRGYGAQGIPLPGGGPQSVVTQRVLLPDVAAALGQLTRGGRLV